METTVVTPTKMKYFTADCFQTPSGRYLSYEEHDRSRVQMMARDEQEAFERLAEMEQVDSELTIEERWNVYETTEYHFKNNQLPVIGRKQF